MSDRTVTSKQLKLVANFEDGDDRTIAIPAPKTTLTKANILTATIPDSDGETFTSAASKVLVSDKTGAKFKNWKSAKVYDTTTVYLDLS